MSLSLSHLYIERERRKRRNPAALVTLLPHQTPPAGAWRGWLLMGGRGSGKTVAGASWLLSQSQRVPWMRVIAPTFADARDTCIEGPAGIKTLAPDRITTYNRSMGELTLTNGARIKLFSADEPDRLRGPQAGADWYDELAAWRYAEAALDMALMGLRLGDDPRYVVTTTPRPNATIRRLLHDPAVVTTRATTYDNTHLPAAFREVLLARYDGTRLGRQEINAELLEDTPGALWTLGQIEHGRVNRVPDLVRIVVGVDPPASVQGECGIVASGKDADDHGYVLADDSISGTPGEWAAQVIRTFIRANADLIVPERNNGGDMVEHTIRTTTVEVNGATVRGANLPIESVWASRGKYTRAEPISVLYGNEAQPARVHHVGGFALLENEMTTYVPGNDSPNRLDALVWSLTALFPNIEGSEWWL